VNLNEHILLADKKPISIFFFVQGWNSFERLPEDIQHNDETIYVQNGFSNFLQKIFVDKITEDKIQLNTIIKRICIHEDEHYIDIEMIKKDQQQLITYQAKHVVCTQSIGCLKQSMHQLFIPPLPHAKRMSIQKLGFGTINKVCLRDKSIKKRINSIEKNFFYRFFWFFLNHFGMLILKHLIFYGIQID
jgi:hypothetical protein